jgi:hypothetical protein
MARPPIRERWREEVITSTAITDATRVLLLVLMDDMDARGYVSVPRDALAKRLKRNERKVSARFEDAVSAQLLDRVVRGNRGRTAVYRAMLPTAESLPEGGSLPERKAAGSIQPFAVENRHPMDGERLPHGGPASSKATSETEPRRRQHEPVGSTSVRPSSSIHQKTLDVEPRGGEPQLLGEVIELVVRRRSA